MMRRVLFTVLILWTVVQSATVAQTATPSVSSPASTRGTRTEAEQHLSLAAALYKEGKLDEALVEVREAVRLNPFDDGARDLLKLIQLTLRVAPPQQDAPRVTTPTKSAAAAELTSPSALVVLHRNTPVVLWLSESVTSGSGEELVPTLQVRHDVKVDEFVVVPKGTEVKFSVDRQNAGDLTEPGILLLKFESVPSVSGNEVRLVGAEVAEGRKEDVTLCGECGWFAFPGYLALSTYAHTMKGREGKLTKGILTAAYVADDVVFDRPTLAKANAELMGRAHPAAGARSSKAHLHFYYNFVKPTPEKNDFLVPGVAVRIDGRKLGGLKAWQYACTDIEPGGHRLQVGKEQSQVTLDADKEYFIRMQNIGERMSVDLTDGYEIDARPLLPGRFKKSFAVECWDR
jgi:hypothetical protein